MSEKTFTANRIASKEKIEFKSRDVSYSLSDDWLAASSSSDIHNLFTKFNKMFFWGKLDGVKLEWSNKMTLCAGKCYSRPRQKYYCIRLSRPLLSQRPHSDLIETLLHEMIHAYLTVTKTRDGDSHGTKFQEHMHRINKAVGTNISVYHTFHAEVKSLKQHWWRCDGPCQKRSPFFGWVKRATNRAPGPWDSWWRSHCYRCGGRFVKVKEPMDYTKQRVKGLFGYGVSLPTSRLALNNFGFEFMHCEETFGRQNKVEIAPPDEFVLTAQKITRNDLIECPVCTKRISKGVLSEHLNVCGDVQRLFEEDRVDLGEKDCGNLKKNEVDLSNCPVCDEALFKNSVKEHLEKCDGLQGIFDDDNFGRSDVTCPFCYMEVQGDLSSHISRCLSGDILSISDGNDFESRTEGEEGLEKCLVCEKTLSNISLKYHLESCEGLQGVFDDDIITLDDSKDCENCVDTNCVQHCPFCDSEVADLADHFSKCVSSYDKPNLTCTTTEIVTCNVQTVTSINSSGVNMGVPALNTCPICGLDVRNGLRNHLERECLLSTVGVSEEVDLSFALGNNKASVRNSGVAPEVLSKNDLLKKSSDSTCNKWSRNNNRPFSITIDKRGSENDVKNSLINSDRSRRKDTGVKDPCENASRNSNIINQNIPKDDSEPLVRCSLFFCRGCGKFYSVSLCPVCCGKK